MATTNGSSKGRFLVIGAGYAGLASAIELKRNGFEVEVLEAVDKLTTQGDIIQIGSSASRIISRWGKTLDSISATSGQPKVMTMISSSGEVLLEAPLPSHFDGFPVLFSHRGYIQQHIYDYALSIGVKFRFGARVKHYFEEHDHAGVIIGDEKVTADGVVACDGIHSTARVYVTGKQQKARTSGYAVYRSWFPLERLARDPLTKHLVDSDDVLLTWLGENVHAHVVTTHAAEGAVVFVTHRDTEEAPESWSNPGNMKDMLSVVEDWDPIVRAAVAQVPEETLIDWKLLWRDPLRKWVSDKGRVVLVGDSAHPHLPTSGSGAAQAIEDSVTLGVVVNKLGKDKLATAFRAFEKIRYERTSLTQRLGWETRHRWHQTDWDAVKRDPEYLKMPQPTWLYCHNAEQYAKDRVAEAARSVETGESFVSTNTPEGHVHEDWTVEMMMALEDKQVEEQFYKTAKT